ncbi:uncharacterized protein LOC133039930 isoform X2 [Cannabis sativa]|uniref:uncharacterized protein LOC133039930 isoform X2 n=1 Tax=Cannabis sativa TaxID=3483 RepID=UPI0029CAA49E|nr:uncharacterized protein LOC133039930 isoform X2 [Cannabis sativa]
MASYSEIKINHENAIKKLLKRLKELDNFKHSGSTKEGEIENLQQIGQTLVNKPLYNNNKNNNNKKLEQQRLKIELEHMNKFNDTLDKCEERFLKYNIPKRYQNGRKQPLESYLKNLHEFMEMTWRKNSKKNRAKGYMNLRELMRKIDRKNDKENGIFAYSYLVNCVTQLGIKISKFIIEYIFLILVASNTSNETVSLCLNDLLAIIDCLSVEEGNEESFAVNILVMLLLPFFINALKLVGPFWDNDDYNDGDDDNKDKKIKIKDDDEEEEVTFIFDEEIEDDIVHHIIMEVLRLEVCICSPEFSIMLINDVIFSMSKHLEDNVFKEKFEGIEYKINMWKNDVDFILKEDSDDDDDDDDDQEMKFLREVLEAGVFDLWSRSDLSKLIKLVMI